MRRFFTSIFELVHQRFAGPVTAPPPWQHRGMSRSSSGCTRSTHRRPAGINLFETHPNLNARDAIFAILALNHEIDAILTPERAFEEVDELERIDSVDNQSLATLTG